jgi:hypothetical protein
MSARRGRFAGEEERLLSPIICAGAGDMADVTLNAMPTDSGT